MKLKRLKVPISIYLFFFISSPLSGQEINQSTSQDSSISKLLKLKTDYNKRMYNSSYYTIQIYYGNLSEADSILKVFSEEFEENAGLELAGHTSSTSGHRSGSSHSSHSSAMKEKVKNQDK